MKRLFTAKKPEHAHTQGDCYTDWLEESEEYDRRTSGHQWRETDESQLYDYLSIRKRLEKLRRLRKKGDDEALLFALNEGIHGNTAGIGQARLYQEAKSGTKLLIEDFISEICMALIHLSHRETSAIPWEERREFFHRASHCYGRSALMLSGGGTLGYFHFGVLKALVEQKLCPRVISGASAGAFVAAIIGTRTDGEYLQLFEGDALALALTSNREDIKIGFGSGDKIDMGKIKRELARLIPDMTFLEAFEKTGRSINITVSPAEPRQNSRLLNHMSSPSVTIRSAVLASSALPGVFRPVQLEARNVRGKVQPYLPSRRWIDGSFSQDLPARRLARMHGVNHFIVSQVMPGLGREPRLHPGVRKILSDASVAATKEVVRGSLDLIQRYFTVGPKTGVAMNTLNALIDQRYSGDINIYPKYGFESLASLLKVLSPEEMIELFKDGERATWPRMPAIEATTRIGRTLDEILHTVEADDRFTVT
ncbi:MAG: DUF3336 domain-containing protein [Halioglobus sp.]|nr:DUF3336 domain-containing protein [Halioglobus sp.]